MNQATSEESKELLNMIARFDKQTDTLAVTDLGQNRYPCEPIFGDNSKHPEQGWILTLVYDGNYHQSQVWIYDSDRLEAKPICKLQLPSVIPHSFHGTWMSR